MSVSRPFRSPACERARVWVSQELDGELSELELAALRSHLADCPACGAFAVALRAQTGELRAAPQALPEPFRLPQRRPALRPLALAASVAAVAVAVGVGSLVGSLTRGAEQPLRLQAAGGGKTATQEPYVEQSLLAMLEHLHPPTGRTVAV